MDQNPMDQERETMIMTQLVDRGISDAAVLGAFQTVPRHPFVRPADRDWAYGDHPLAIGFGQTISQPYVVALALSAIRTAKLGNVLEIGTGSGYQTALLASLATAVWTVERIGALARRAQETLAVLGYRNVRFRTGNGVHGWPEGAPYEAIVVSAAARAIPPALLDQLAVGGRMAIPLGDGFSQTLTLVTKTADGFATEALCGCRFVPLIDAE